MAEALDHLQSINEPQIKSFWSKGCMVNNRDIQTSAIRYAGARSHCFSFRKLSVPISSRKPKDRDNETYLEASLQNLENSLIHRTMWL